MLNNMFLTGASEEKNFIEDLFSCYLYTGNGSTQTITNGIDLAGKGGLVWIKGRSGSAAPDHILTDTARGATNFLVSNSTNGQSTNANTLTAFASNGFSVGSYVYVNSNDPYFGTSFASWTFRKAPKFFDVVTFTGTTSSNQRIQHSLGVVPGLIIVKVTSGTSHWYTWHRSLSSATDSYLHLNTTQAAATTSGRWGTSGPTATDFGIDSANYIGDGATAVAYLFAHDTTADGVIQCGSFTKDGSNNATVTLGWEPQYVLVKSTNGSGVAVGDSWLIADIMRGANESLTNYLRADLSNADATNGGPWCVPTATGFKIQQLSGGSNHIYLAIRRGPMRVPTDATKVYSVETHSNPSLNTTYTYTTGFPVDMLMQATRSGATGKFLVSDRLRTPNNNLNSNSIATYDTSGETAINGYAKLWFDNNTGFSIYDTNGSWNGSPTYPSAASWSFRRAPGFFDVVCYTGTGATLSVSHNLGATPELLILKRRNSTGGWPVWRTATGAGTTFGYLNDNGAEADQGVSILTAPPTSSAFSVGAWGPINASGGTYVAYLFASCPGVSKVGSYTGNGSSLNIDCGFTNGARFVLIKRTDSTGDWYVWDTARGIVSANDPHLSLNTSAAEVTTNDSIDPLSSGFTVNQVAATNVNVNAATYIYLAIA